MICELQGNEHDSIPQFNCGSRDKWIFSHNTSYMQNTVSHPALCRTNWRDTHLLSLFPANIKRRAIPKPSEVPELSNDVELRQKESWTSSWEKHLHIVALCFFSVTALNTRSPASHFAGWGIKFAPLLLSFLRKFILLGIYLSSWICELYLSSLLKIFNHYSNMSSATFYFSPPILQRSSSLSLLYFPSIYVSWMESV